MCRYSRHPWWMAFALLLTAAVRSASAGACDASREIYSGRVFWHGPTGTLYINTPVWACIADAGGECVASGGYLYLENQSSDQWVDWTSLGAGEPVFRALGPHQKFLKYLPIYRGRNDPPLEVDLQVRVCPPTGPGNGGTTPPNPLPAGSETYFIDLNDTFTTHGQWRYQGFTVYRNTTFDVRFVTDYAAQAALIPETELDNFTNGRGFSGYAVFDQKFGTYTSVTLGPGTYYAAARNSIDGSNKVRLELDTRLTVPDAQFAGWDISGAQTVQGGGGQLWHSFTVSPGLRYFIDGCNTGVETYVLPDAELANFTSGQTFRYYVDYSTLDDESAPGYWEVRLPPGTYWLAFRNRDSKPHAITYQMERWRVSPSSSTSRSPVEDAEPSAARGGLQTGWVNRPTATINLRFSEALDPKSVTADRFRVSVGDVTVAPTQVQYFANGRVVRLVVPELEQRQAPPSVSWTGLITASEILLNGSSDPLVR